MRRALIGAVMFLALATSALAQPRSEELQAPGEDEVQAPRTDEIQAPRGGETHTSRVITSVG